jgi:ABC-type multidrug transport system fused ATPase/permease subunit
VKKIKKVLDDIIYVSRLTQTKNKKLLISSSILLSQLAAGTDLLLIGIFASIIAGQFTNLEYLNLVLDFFIGNKQFIIVVIFIRYYFNYLQFIILKKIEIDVTINLKKYMFSKILEQKNFSRSDTYYFLNTLSTHIAFFYSNFAQFLNSFLQSIAYITYLLLADTSLVSYFGVSVLILSFPIFKLISSARNYMHKTYSYGKEANQDLVNAVENLPLIKILRMEDSELNNFSKAVKQVYEVSLKNYKIGFLNQQLPNFFTLLIFSIILNIPRFLSRITLDFLGVTIRLFQALSTISSSLSQVANSHIHIAEFINLEYGNAHLNSNFFKLEKTSEIKLQDVNFKYQQSDDYIFEDLNLKLLKNSHTIIVGPNGSGKSTLLGLIGNVLIPENGSLVSFSDNFSYIGATPFIFSKTLKENILYGNKLNINDVEIINMLEMFNVFKEKSSLDLSRNVESNTLSSGQMQKIGFIRALLSKPDILLLDESMANLDDSSQVLVLDQILKQNITVINSTHDPDRYQDVDNVIRIDIRDEKRIVNLSKKL